MESLYVIVSMLIIFVVALITVTIKVYLFPMMDNGTFVPLDQEINSNIKYTGPGFIPCDGFVPSPSRCHFPPYFSRLQRPH